eukprot:TRINITY_DN14227_c0_g3_i1.p1 TRINITY_DN14227_c0_g3~~TRINITY_DN14227_c0_g3_i1.p1  ORF type:complete len:670 (-),score=140.05 TRINITY_DN14227_c0_g3_i1:87-2096(-)
MTLLNRVTSAFQAVTGPAERRSCMDRIQKPLLEGEDNGDRDSSPAAGRFSMQGQEAPKSPTGSAAGGFADGDSSGSKERRSSSGGISLSGGAGVKPTVPRGRSSTYNLECPHAEGALAVQAMAAAKARGGGGGESDESGSDAPIRERADIADLVRTMQSLDAGRPSPSSPVLTKAARSHKRQLSWCDAEQRRRDAPEVSEARRQLCTPGGFRRHHLNDRADQEGRPQDRRPAVWSVSLATKMLRSVDFYQESFGIVRSDSCESFLSLEERDEHLMGTWGVALAVLKGNMNANILYVPHAWMASGWVFGLCVQVLVSVVSLFCIIRLIACRQGNQYSYGDITERALGRAGRVAVNLSVILNQAGICCLYLINVAKLLQQIYFHDQTVNQLIIVEAALLSPLCLIRNMAKLAPINLVCGTTCVVAVVVTFGLLAQNLITDGPAPAEEFQPLKGFSGMMVCFGTAAFSMEGIGLVIPIYDATKEPEKFACVYALTISVIVTLLSVMGFLGYMTFGDEVATLVLLSFGKGAGADVPLQPVPRGLMAAFCIGLLGAFPLQLLPAIRLVEGLFLGPSRPFTCDKHVKNMFRVVFIAFLAVIAMVGATSLDHFVSLIGSLCGAPLAFIFPAACHWCLVARPWSVDAAFDLSLIVFGLVVTVMVTADTLLTWGGGSD